MPKLESPVVAAFNDGGGSTKLAVHRGQILDSQRLLVAEVRYSQEQLARFPTILDQLPMRTEAVRAKLAEMGINPASLSAIIARGGPVKSLAGGVYHITSALVRDIKEGRIQTMHPSLLSSLIACAISDEPGILRLMAADVSVDELERVARITGFPGIERRALSHALSCRAAAKRAATKLDRPFEDCQLVVAHLGTGVTVAAYDKGRQVDSSDANGDSPFAPQRAGALPTEPLVQLCFSGKYSEDQILALIRSRGGLLAHLGTDNLEEVEKRVDQEDEQAWLIWNAMVYQIIKGIAAYAAVLNGHADAIVITGGMAHSTRLINTIQERTSWITQESIVFPGELTEEFMVETALRVLNGQEDVRTY